MIGRMLSLLAAVAICLGAFGATASDRGSKEEAQAMAERALAVFNEQGIEAVSGAVMDQANPDFHDRDLYVFIYSMDGVNVAHGAKPQLVGKNLISLRDQDGVELIREMVSVTEGGGSGWVDYKWPNPTNNAIENKSAYVVALGDAHFAGVGIYAQ